MTILLDVEQNLPSAFIFSLSLHMGVPVHRIGNFYKEKTGPGCGRECIWNGGGYYMDMFICGRTYPSGNTFYCSSDCYRKIGDSRNIFLSYRWCDAEVANSISNCMRGAGINILRDINAMRFLETISSFMDSADEARYFVAVMTESYFYSRYCMYEFCQISGSAQPIRTIPVMLGNSSEFKVEEQLQNYWHERYRDLHQRIRGIDPSFSNYLSPELDLLADIPRHIESFYKLWREKERPGGKHWLIANCCYLVGAIKTTFQPSEEDATNWTYSNPTVRFEQAEDAPHASVWEAQPFFLHAYSDIESRIVTQYPGARKHLLGVYHDSFSPIELLPGFHMVLIDESALSSLTFCIRLLYLFSRDDITVVPIFLDKALQAPTSETILLQQWYNRLINTTDSKERVEIATMLKQWGYMVQRLRDILAPSADVVFARQ